jgi:type II secretory pathway component GspD/PulD (secretin)
MSKPSLTSITSLVLSAALLCPTLPAQTPQNPPAVQGQERNFVKPDPKRAKKLFEQASKEEAAGDYLAALSDYEDAARYAPFDVNIVSKGVALRSRLLREHVDAAERMAIQGNMDAATLQLAAALEIDPGNPAVLERLQQMSSMTNATQSAARLEPAAGLPQLAPAKVTRSFNFQGDLKSAYEHIAQTFSLKVTFDPDLPAGTTRLRLPDVDFYTAMKVLSLQTGTFWRALDAQTFFVSADTAEKRREFEPEIEQTLLLPASVNTTDVGEVVRAIRDLTGITRVSQSYQNHSITVRGTVQRVRLAQQIVENLEQAPGEVLLEIDLLEVDRSNARNLGITPPSSLSLYSVPPSLANSLRSAPDLTSLLTLLAQVFGGVAGIAAAGGIASLASSIPPIAAIGGGKSTFLLALPTFTAQFSEGLSLVHSGREVLLRAQDGKPATFFVGDRYPITLSLLSNSLGSTGFSPNPGGTGVTIPTQQITVGNNPVAMVTADFRSSGAQDLALINQGDNALTILLNQGVGIVPQFAQPTTGIGPLSPIALGTKWTSSTRAPALATGSLNAASTAATNDNFADLLVTDPVGNTVIVLLGNGDGTFKTPAIPIPVGNQPSSIAIGTFNLKNSDSNPGFVVANFLDNTYSVFKGNGDGTFTPVTGSPFALPSTATGPVAITSADFNGDGYPDLAIVNQTTQNVSILKGNGDGTFTEFINSPLPVGKTPVNIASGSLSGSTGPGLAIVNQADNSVTVYLGNGDGTFVASSQSPLATGTTPTGVAIADFTQQSNGGIAVTNTGAGTVIVYADLGSGLFANALEPGAGTNPSAIVAGPFTNGTFPDIVVTNNLSGEAGQVTLIVSPVSLISLPGQNQQPYPGSEYEDIGIKIKATPHLHETKDVTLLLEFEIKALAGSSVNGIPVITNRTVTQTVRVKENETSLIVGLLNRNETQTITGIPGLATLPGIGYAFGNRNSSFDDDELLFLITPRRVRSPFHESETFYAGTGDTGGRSGARGNIFVPGREREPEQPAPAQPAPAEPAAPPPAPQPAPPPAQQPNEPEVPLQQPPPDSN